VPIERIRPSLVLLLFFALPRASMPLERIAENRARLSASRPEQLIPDPCHEFGWDHPTHRDPGRPARPCAPSLDSIRNRKTPERLDAFTAGTAASTASRRKKALKSPLSTSHNKDGGNLAPVIRLVPMHRPAKTEET
jgi:hypothetical protein